MIAKRGALLAAAVIAVAGVAVQPADAAASSHHHSVHGCPYGWECLYKHDNYRGNDGLNKPDQKFYHYGLHRISGFTDESGSTVDNQSSSDGGTKVGFTCYYRDSAGTNFYSADRGSPAQSTPHFDLLPVNSVRLVQFSHSGDTCPYTQ